MLYTIKSDDGRFLGAIQSANRDDAERKVKSPLTALQREHLDVLGKGPWLADPGNRTLRSLARRGLVIYRRSGAKYLGNAWHLTAAGVAATRNT